MDKQTILDAGNRLVKTLQNVGYIHESEYSYLMIMMFLRELVDNGMAIGLTHDELVQINQILRCFRDNGRCVTRDIDFVDELGWDNFHIDLDSIITNDFITISTGDGAEMVASNRVVTKFMDFNHQYTFDPNDFVVGYDDETNTETRVNVGTIASIWS